MNAPLISGLLFIVAVNVIVSCADDERHIGDEYNVRHVSAKLRRRLEVLADDDRLNRHQGSPRDFNWKRNKRINKDKRRKNRRNSTRTPNGNNADAIPEADRRQAEGRGRALPEDRGMNIADPKKQVDNPDDTVIERPEAIPIAVPPYSQRRVTVNWQFDRID